MKVSRVFLVNDVKNRASHQHRYIVALVNVVAHPQELRCMRRGIQPEVIQI